MTSAFLQLDGAPPACMAIDTATGNVRWTRYFDDCIVGLVSAVAVVGNDGTVTAYHEAHAEELWRATCGGQSSAAASTGAGAGAGTDTDNGIPMATYSEVYGFLAVSVGSQTCIFDEGHGQRLWMASTPGSAVMPPRIMHNGDVVVATASKLLRYARSSGDVVWQHTTAGIPGHRQIVFVPEKQDQRP